MTLTTPRFSGLHICDLTQLSQEQRKRFGKDICHTPAGAIELVFSPYLGPAFPVGSTTGDLNYNGRFVRFYYTDQATGETFEEKLGKYASTFENHYGVTVPRVFDASQDNLTRLDYKDYVTELPGMEDNLKKLDTSV